MAWRLARGTDLAQERRPQRDWGSGMKSIAIIGAGPAGLSAARLLEETGRVRAVVFEKSERIGGKSFSTPRFGVVHDMGTCYSTLAHTLTNRWMRELGIRQKAIGRQEVDGVPLRKFISGGRTFATVGEAARFVQAWRRQMRDFETRADDPEVRAIAAAPVSDWLERNGLSAIRRFALRALTNMGYGFLDQTTTVQALRWCTPTLLLSGSLDQIKAPQGGWQAFWERMSQTLDVRFGQPVVAVARNARGVEVTTPTGAQKFDALLVAAPLDELPFDLTEAERDVRAAVSWDTYVTSLVGVRDWYPGEEVVAFQAALQPGAPKGVLLSARPAGRRPKVADGVRHFMTGQYGGGLDAAQLVDRLSADLSARGAKLDYVAVQRIWKYCPHYAPQAVRDGLLKRMEAMQGEARTWYAGSTFSFESVANIVAHNQALAPRIVGALEA